MVGCGRGGVGRLSFGEVPPQSTRRRVTTQVGARYTDQLNGQQNEHLANGGASLARLLGSGGNEVEISDAVELDTGCVLRALELRSHGELDLQVRLEPEKQDTETADDLTVGTTTARTVCSIERAGIPPAADARSAFDVAADGDRMAGGSEAVRCVARSGAPRGTGGGTGVRIHLLRSVLESRGPDRGGKTDAEVGAIMPKVRLHCRLTRGGASGEKCHLRHSARADSTSEAKAGVWTGECAVATEGLLRVHKRLDETQASAELELCVGRCGPLARKVFECVGSAGENGKCLAEMLTELCLGSGASGSYCTAEDEISPEPAPPTELMAVLQARCISAPDPCTPRTLTPPRPSISSRAAPLRTCVKRRFSQWSPSVTNGGMLPSPPSHAGLRLSSLLKRWRTPWRIPQRQQQGVVENWRGRRLNG